MFSFVLYQGAVSDFHIEDMFHKTGVHVLSRCASELGFSLP